MECQAKRLKHRCFPVEFAKFLKTEVYERPILKPAVSPGVSFFISYTCGSNWYLAQQTFVLMKTSWRCLSSSSSEDVFKTSSRRLDQDEYVRLSLTSSEDVFKTSWSRPIYSSWLYVFKTSSRRFQDVFKTSCKNVFKTSSRRLQDVLQRYLQDVFKTYHQVKLFA